MSGPALYDQIIQKLRTTSDVTHVLRCLEELDETIFSAKTPIEKGEIFREVPKDIADMLTAAFINLPATPENKIVLKREIDDLSDRLRGCKNIQLTIAFHPDEETITFFSEWVKKNVSPTILIDLQFDKTIVGGAQIIANGVFKDYSVRKKLANRFQIQREDIVALLD